MLAPIAFPKWLPPAVAQEARHLLKVRHSEVALRLATDDRMKFVWRELKKYKVPSGGVYQGELPPGFLPVTWPDAWKDLPFGYGGLRSAVAKYFFDNQLTDQEAALALFFRHARCYADPQVSKAGTVAERDAMVAVYREHARQLRKSAAEMRRIAKPKDNPAPFGEGTPEDGSARIVLSLIKNVERAAGFFDYSAASTLMAGSHFPPIKRARHKKNLHARGYVRSLATVTRKLFSGGPLYGTLATVASVALEKDITKDQVIDWTKGLP